MQRLSSIFFKGKGCLFYELFESEVVIQVYFALIKSVLETLKCRGAESIDDRHIKPYIKLKDF